MVDEKAVLVRRSESHHFRDVASHIPMVARASAKAKAEAAASASSIQARGRGSSGSLSARSHGSQHRGMASAGSSGSLAPSPFVRVDSEELGRQQVRRGSVDSSDSMDDSAADAARRMLFTASPAGDTMASVSEGVANDLASAVHSAPTPPPRRRHTGSSTSSGPTSPRRSSSSSSSASSPGLFARLSSRLPFTHRASAGSGGASAATPAASSATPRRPVTSAGSARRARSASTSWSAADGTAASRQRKTRSSSMDAADYSGEGGGVGVEDECVFDVAPESMWFQIGDTRVVLGPRSLAQTTVLQALVDALPRLGRDPSLFMSRIATITFGRGGASAGDRGEQQAATDDLVPPVLHPQTGCLDLEVSQWLHTKGMDRRCRCFLSCSHASFFANAAAAISCLLRLRCRH